MVTAGIIVEDLKKTLDNLQELHDRTFHINKKKLSRAIVYISKAKDLVVNSSELR